MTIKNKPRLRWWCAIVAVVGGGGGGGGSDGKRTTGRGGSRGGVREVRHGIDGARQGHDQGRCRDVGCERVAGLCKGDGR